MFEKKLTNTITFESKEFGDKRTAIYLTVGTRRFDNNNSQHID